MRSKRGEATLILLAVALAALTGGALLLSEFKITGFSVLGDGRTKRRIRFELLKPETD